MNFIEYGFDMSVDAYLQDADNFFVNAKSWTAIRNSCFIAALLISYFGIVVGFINRLKNEIWQTKGLLNLIPTKFVLSNHELKVKFLSHQGL